MPKSPGVYLFKDAAGKIIYIGKANSLRDRVSSYFRNPSRLSPKTAVLVSEIADFDHIDTASEIDALLLEADLVSKFLPKYNISLKDDKAYPYIEISGEKIPQVKIVRKKDHPKSQYFGPFPVGTNLTPLLRYLRRIFPFVSQNHPRGRACLRSHLGTCPCPQIFSDKRALKAYKQNLKDLAIFLSGRRRQLQKRLEKQMLKLSKNQEFEAAADIRNKLEQIACLTSPRTQSWEYITNPNLVTDQRRESLRQLSTVLKIKKISRVECFDVATISGKSASGARAVFVDGEPEKKLYRRYRLVAKTQPDDLAMMREMLTRRLKNKDEKLPDLLVVDGGVNQLKVATETATLLGKKVPVIALAKKLETIHLPQGQTINLSLDSPALHLLQRLRDEAHRFSRRYHFWQRRKAMLG